MRVSNAALPSLPADVARPRYDRATVTPGIVHLGIGAFHRAHQAVYLDDCLAAGETGWKSRPICGLASAWFAVVRARRGSEAYLADENVPSWLKHG